MSSGVTRQEIILRTEISTSPYLIGPYEYVAPGLACFLENLSDQTVRVYIIGGKYRDRLTINYGSFSPVTLRPYGRQMLELDDVEKYLGFYLDAVAGDGVKVTLNGVSPPPIFDTLRV
jgi:hypothetical protein